MDGSLHERAKLGLDHTKRFRRELRYLLLVLFFGVFLVFDTVALIDQIGAHHAVMAVAACHAKTATIASLRALAKSAIRAADAVHELIRPLAFERRVEVHAGDIFVRAGDVERVLAPSGIEAKITVFVVARMVAVFGVFIAEGDEGALRHTPQQLTKLRKEWSREVEISTDSEGIDPIRPPDILIADGIGLRRSVDGDDIRTRDVACAVVEGAFIAEC